MAHGSEEIMKTLLGLAFLFAASVGAETLTQADRDKAIRHLNETKTAFLASIQGLSAAQWNFKPAPEVWSVAEVAEHITVSENTIMDLMQKKVLAAPADPQLLAESKGKDELLQPKARWTQSEIPEVFTASRDKTIEFIRSSQEDLRGHAMAHPVLKALD